jgi:hypothetical protein
MRSEELSQIFSYSFCSLFDKELNLKFLSYSWCAALQAASAALPALQHRSLFEISMKSLANSMGEGVAFLLRM